MGIGHVALLCADLATMERFYCDKLGYRAVWRPDAQSCYLSNGRDNLALHLDARAATHDTRLDHFGLIVAEAGDVDQWAEHLSVEGIPFDVPPRTHRDGTRSLYVRDPEGNRIQILHLGDGMTR
jgi:catechol 2,3-dioxygenase-like lactoylglutathione lyase family enzyme